MAVYGTDVYGTGTYGTGVGTAVTVVKEASTQAEIVELVEAESLEVDYGLELLDSSDSVIDDISEDLVSGEIERGNFRTIHGTCRLRVSKELVWGNQRVRPYMVLTSAEWTRRWNLGVYLLSTPSRKAGETPATYEVDGFDKLEILNHPHGSSYQAPAGASPLTEAEALIVAFGETKIAFDQTAASTVLPTPMTWTLADDPSTLNIVNGLLAAVGYRALYVDNDGWFRSEPYRAPSEQPSVWSFDAASSTTIVGEQRAEGADYFATPNRWVGVIDDPDFGLPVDGNGRYEVVNQSDGPTSVDQRGRVITAPLIRAQVATHGALVTRVERTVEADKSLIFRLDMTCGPNPALAGHFLVFSYRDPELGVDHRYLTQSFVLPLDGAEMSLEAKRV